MSGVKLRIAKTCTDNLISNLRGEVGEIITTWTMWRGLLARERQMSSDDIAKDLRNTDLVFVSVLADKLKDEIIGRLSELAEAKIGRLTFYFAAVKLAKFEEEVTSFAKFVQRNRLTEKRNHDISHKELPEEWSQHYAIAISYSTLLRGIALALHLMKKLDRVVLGPASTYLWHEMRKKRYSSTNPPLVGYMILPHLNLSPTVREKIIMEEMAEGREVWSEMPTISNGKSVTVYASKKWGAILADSGIIVLDQYPLQEISTLNFEEPNCGLSKKKTTPICERRQVAAKYKAADVSSEKIVFTPVQRLHLLESGQITELCDVTIRLGNQAPADLSSVKIGDVREFQMSVTVLVGYKDEQE